MVYLEMSDSAILAELGGRFKRLRLRKNLSQKQLAELTLLSLNTIKSLEAGKAKLSTVIAVLRELGKLNDLEYFLPDPGISPMQLAKSRGKLRQRATGSRGGSRGDSAAEEGTVEW